jgi:hypothetical protein
VGALAVREVVLCVKCGHFGAQTLYETGPKALHSRPQCPEVNLMLNSFIVRLGTPPARPLTAGMRANNSNGPLHVDSHYADHTRK